MRKRKEEQKKQKKEDYGKVKQMHKHENRRAEVRNKKFRSVEYRFNIC